MPLELPAAVPADNRVVEPVFIAIENDVAGRQVGRSQQNVQGLGIGSGGQDAAGVAAGDMLELHDLKPLKLEPVCLVLSGCVYITI